MSNLSIKKYINFHIFFDKLLLEVKNPQKRLEKSIKKELDYFTSLAICLNLGCSAVFSSSKSAISVQVIFAPSAARRFSAICLFSRALEETASAMT